MPYQDFTLEPNDLERLANLPGLARAWRDKIVQRLSWLKKSA